jgi:hypothetical protein
LLRLVDGGLALIDPARPHVSESESHLGRRFDPDK